MESEQPTLAKAGTEWLGGEIHVEANLLLSSGAANGCTTNPKGSPPGMVSEQRVGTVCVEKRQNGSTVLPRISVVGT